MNEPGTDGAAIASGKISITWLSGFGSVEAAPTFSLERVEHETSAD